MVAEFRVWLLWWVWVVAMNAGGVAAYLAAPAKPSTAEDQTNIWLETNRPEVGPDEADRWVTVSAKTSLAPKVDLPLRWAYTGADEVEFDGPITPPMKVGQTEAVVRFRVPRPNPGSSERVVVIKLEPDSRTPIQFVLAAGRDSTKVVVKAATQEPLNPSTPSGPQVRVWLTVDKRELAADATDRLVTFTAHADPAPTATIQLDCRLNDGSLAAGEGFEFADPKITKFMINANEHSGSIGLKIAPLQGTTDKVIKVGLVEGPKSYKLHDSNSTSLSVNVKAPRPAYKILVKTDRSSDPNTGEVTVAVRVEVKGDKTVSNILFGVVPGTAKEGEDYRIDGATPTSGGKYQLTGMVRSFAVRLPINPLLPPKQTIVLMFDPIDGYEFIDPGEGKVEISIVPDDSNRDVLILVAATDDLFGTNGTPTTRAEALAQQLKPLIMKHRGRLVGGGVYVVPFPSVAKADLLPTSWEQGFWDPGKALPKVVNGQFTTWTQDNHLHELCRASFVARAAITDRLKERGRPTPPKTAILWVTEKLPREYGQRAASFERDGDPDAKEAAEKGPTSLFWVKTVPPLERSLQMELRKVFNPVDSEKAIRAGSDAADLLDEWLK